MGDQNIALMAHLMRRAGFGATREELEARVAKGYEATVEELLHPEEQESLGRNEMMRYHPWTWRPGTLPGMGAAEWLHDMVNTRRPLEEKMALQHVGGGLRLAVVVGRAHGVGRAFDVSQPDLAGPGGVAVHSGLADHSPCLDSGAGIGGPVHDLHLSAACPCAHPFKPHPKLISSFWRLYYSGPLGRASLDPLSRALASRFNSLIAAESITWPRHQCSYNPTRIINLLSLSQR